MLLLIPVMVPLKPFRVRLLDEIQEIESLIVELQSRVEITKFKNDPHSAIVFLGPKHRWGRLEASARGFQGRLLRMYRRWFELFSRCYATHSSDLRREIDKVDKFTTEAIELKSGWNVAATHEANQRNLSKILDLSRDLLAVPDGGDAGVAVVADTNAMLCEPDPTKYRQIAGREDFTFVLVPTVLSELDQIKTSRRDKDLGLKAEKVIRRLKGYRAQGSVRDGVIVDHTITVRMIPTEPLMAKLPSWLDAENADDRIIGSVLEIQFSDLDTAALLVTNDINLQNKAEMACLPWCEPP